MIVHAAVERLEDGSVRCTWHETAPLTPYAAVKTVEHFIDAARKAFGVTAVSFVCTPAVADAFHAAPLEDLASVSIKADVVGEEGMEEGVARVEAA